MPKTKLYNLARAGRLAAEWVAGLFGEVEEIASVEFEIPVGINVVPGVPTVHKESVMPKASVKLTKKSSSKLAAKGAKADPGVFNLQDNGDDTFTVTGVDAAGNAVDISTTATMTATSDAPLVVTVDAPTGLTSAIHAAVPAPAVGATANITLVVTMTDGSGVFSVVWPQSIIAGPVSGIIVTPGVPSVH